MVASVINAVRSICPSLHIYGCLGALTSKIHQVFSSHIGSLFFGAASVGSGLYSFGYYRAGYLTTEERNTPDFVKRYYPPLSEELKLAKCNLLLDTIAGDLTVFSKKANEGETLEGAAYGDVASQLEICESLLSSIKGNEKEEAILSLIGHLKRFQTLTKGNPKPTYSERAQQLAEQLVSEGTKLSAAVLMRGGQINLSLARSARNGEPLAVVELLTMLAQLTKSKDLLDEAHKISWSKYRTSGEFFPALRFIIEAYEMVNQEEAKKDKEEIVSSLVEWRKLEKLMLRLDRIRPEDVVASNLMLAAVHLVVGNPKAALSVFNEMPSKKPSKSSVHRGVRAVHLPFFLEMSKELGKTLTREDVSSEDKESLRKIFYEMCAEIFWEISPVEDGKDYGLLARVWKEFFISTGKTDAEALSHYMDSIQAFESHYISDQRLEELTDSPEYAIDALLEVAEVYQKSDGLLEEETIKKKVSELLKKAKEKGAEAEKKAREILLKPLPEGNQKAREEASNAEGTLVKNSWSILKFEFSSKELSKDIRVVLAEYIKALIETTKEEHRGLEALRCLEGLIDIGIRNSDSGELSEEKKIALVALWEHTKTTLKASGHANSRIGARLVECSRKLTIKGSDSSSVLLDEYVQSEMVAASKRYFALFAATAAAWCFPVARPLAAAFFIL